jgi:hypothetical protein
MGGKQNGKKGFTNKYQPLKTENLQREINPGVQIPPAPVTPQENHSNQEIPQEISQEIPQEVQRPTNPFRIVGQARVSKSGMSLSIRLIDGLNFRFITVLRSDIVKLFTDNNSLSVADVREYDNSNTTR